MSEKDLNALIERLERNAEWRDERWQCITDPSLLKEAAQALRNLEAIRAAMRRYLPPDSGITAEEFASEVIGIVDGRGK